jgi:hypothetical protein
MELTLSGFNSIEEAEVTLKQSYEEIHKILTKDLGPKNDIDCWFTKFGENEDYAATKKFLVDLEMVAYDAEIYINHHRKEA